MQQRAGLSYWGLGIAAALGAQWIAQACLADAPPPAPRTIVLKAAHLFDSVSGTLTEHGVYLDGHDTPEQREHGTGQRHHRGHQERGVHPR